MKIFGRFSPAPLAFAGFLFLCQSAWAETLKDTVGKLQVLPLHYGVNNIRIGSDDVLIVRGQFQTDTAGGGDVYTVLVKKGDLWKMAHHEEGAPSSVLTITNPHMEEDSIVSVRFMIPQDAETSGVRELYLLKASRKYAPDDINTDTTFTFYALKNEKDFGRISFHKVYEERPETEYCNADLALKRELNIPFPGDESVYLLCTTWEKK
jgi:hypothetical protein